MITINKGEINKVVLTLSERTTIVDATYLFTFINDQSDVIKSFIAEDISVNKIRYNQFAIEENAVENLLNGVVSLDQEGSWTYAIREQASVSNLIVANSGAIVEIGIVKVFDSSAAIPTFTEQTTEIKVFNG
jgi:VCBS repeat-containing protein